MNAVLLLPSRPGSTERIAERNEFDMLHRGSWRLWIIGLGTRRDFSVRRKLQQYVRTWWEFSRETLYLGIQLFSRIRDPIEEVHSIPAPLMWWDVLQTAREHFSKNFFLPFQRLRWFWWILIFLMFEEEEKKLTEKIFPLLIIWAVAVVIHDVVENVL